MNFILSFFRDRKKKKIVLILFFLLIIALTITLIFLDNKTNDSGYDDSLLDPETGALLYEDPESTLFSSGDIEATDQDLFGEYENYNPEDDYYYLISLFENYTNGDADTQLIQNFLDYKFPIGEYIEDSSGGKISIGSDGKPFMLYFTYIYQKPSGEYVVDNFGEEVKNNKEEIFENLDMNVYILPASTEILKENFFKVFPNGNYYNNDSISKNFVEILNKTNEMEDIAIYFDGDGTFRFVTSAVPLISSLETVVNSYSSNITIQEAFNKIIESKEKLNNN